MQYVVNGGGVVTWPRAVEYLVAVGNCVIEIRRLLLSYKFDDIVVSKWLYCGSVFTRSFFVGRSGGGGRWGGGGGGAGRQVGVGWGVGGVVGGGGGGGGMRGGGGGGGRTIYSLILTNRSV